MIVQDAAGVEEMAVLAVKSIVEGDGAFVEAGGDDDDFKG